MEKISVDIHGSGYVGEELNAILSSHEHIAEVHQVNRYQTGPIESDSAVAFLALPHGLSAPLAKSLVEQGQQVIDLSGDFRFSSAKDYEEWYKTPHGAPELLPRPYALPELHREQLLEQPLLSMPGCYPTGALLGLMPFIKAGLVSEDQPIKIKAISGVSGMGKGRKELGEGIIAARRIQPYSTGRAHRHVGEIEQFLDGRRISFYASLGPFFRGIVLKSTFKATQPLSHKVVHEMLAEAYKDEPFVHISPIGQTPNLNGVAGGNDCNLGATAGSRIVKLVGVLDNLRKGASSQAVQAFNVSRGLPETTGLII